MSELFTCPKCASPLYSENTAFVCKQKHCYDRAKSGYVNLLLSGAPKNHGDDALMVCARRDFLKTDYYLPLCNAISAAVCTYAPSSPAILDIGCGEGYYSEKIFARLSSAGKKADYYGIDISKKAAELSAKRSVALHIAVASAYNMPFADSVFDLALNLFSPLSPTEIHRVLKSDGIFILVVPGKNHLFELKSAVYQNPYKKDLPDNNLDGFSLLEIKDIAFPIELRTNEDIVNLFKMTPYYYKTSKEDFEKLFSLNAIIVTAEFKMMIYQNNKAAVI